MAVLLVATPSRAGDAGREFATPPGLAPVVQFWIDVFTRYSVTDVILHDRLHPERVFRVLPATDADRIASEARAIGEWLVLDDVVPRPSGFFAPPAPPRVGAPRGRARVRAQRGMRETLMDGLVAKRLYGPVVEEALATEGLPAGLSALPLIESSYHPGATSRAGAAGLWQLTEATGRLYLRVEPGLDERRDPELSSEAAARHLRALRLALPNWPLAVTAYNRGLAGVQRARRVIGTDELGMLVSRFRGPGFGFSARNFYAEFLAALHVSRNAERYFPNLWPARVVEYRVREGDTLLGVARRHGVSARELRARNGLTSALLAPGMRLIIPL